MPRIDRITFRGHAQRHADALALIANPGDVALVFRGVARALAIRCPDGCGEVISVNLDRRSGPAWSLYQRRDKLTVYPSVLRPTGCKSHFIIWRDEILWCGHDRESPAVDDAQDLQDKIVSILPRRNRPQRHFEELAAELQSPPWDVLWACYRLEAAGIAASSQKQTYFGLAI